MLESIFWFLCGVAVGYLHPGRVKSIFYWGKGKVDKLTGNGDPPPPPPVTPPSP